MNATAPDPLLILALVAVAEELSFSKAAHRLGITKGTVSRKIARLEDQLVVAAYASPSYVARKGQPRTLGDTKHDWFLFTPPRVSAQLTAREEHKWMGTPKGFVPKVRVNDFFLLRDLLQRGVGVGLLPMYFAEAAVRGGALVRVLGKIRLPDSGGIFLVVPSRRRMPRHVEAFRSHVLERLPSLLRAR